MWELSVVVRVLIFSGSSLICRKWVSIQSLVWFCRVTEVLRCLKHPMEASRWILNLLNVNQAPLWCRLIMVFLTPTLSCWRWWYSLKGERRRCDNFGHLERRWWSKNYICMLDEKNFFRKVEGCFFWRSNYRGKVDNFDGFKDDNMSLGIIDGMSIRTEVEF